MTENVLTVCVTGAAGQIAYSLLPHLVSGRVFGETQRVRLHLLEIAPALPALRGVAMELQDLAAPLLHSVLETSDADVAFAGASVAVLVGAIPRRKGEERSDLLARNLPIFRAQGAALRRSARRDCRVLVVGNPANTNALVIARASGLAPRQVHALTQLDANRARALAAARMRVRIGDVHGVCVWGNHSATQYPDVTRAEAHGRSVLDELGGHARVRDDFIPTIQKRGKAIIDARGLSSAMSAAKAIADHLRAWCQGSSEPMSMAVPCDGGYGVAAGVWYSFPVRCKGDWNYEIVGGIELDEFSRAYMRATADELHAERAAALALLDEAHAQ